MKHRIPWLTLSLAAIAVGLNFLPGATTALEFDRPALAAGELWRGWTGHLVHFNASHLAWDLLMLLILGIWTERTSRRGLAVTCALSAAVISGAVWIIQPGLATYRGLSGVDCALFGFVLANLFRTAKQQRDRPLQIVTLVAGLCFLAKTIFEFTSGQALFAESHDVFVPVPLAHLAGVLTGLTVQTLTLTRQSAITPFYGTDGAII